MIRRTLETLATVLVLLAVWLIGSLDIQGQYLMLAAQALWFAWSVLTRHWPLAVQSVVLEVLTINAIITWSHAL
jgi:hypothetical protein